MHSRRLLLCLALIAPCASAIATEPAPHGHIEFLWETPPDDATVRAVALGLLVNP